MCRYQIKISKVLQKDLILFKMALNNYVSIQHALIDMLPNNADNYKMRIGVAVELYYDFHSRTEKQKPANHSMIDLPLHKAIVLKEALQDQVSQKTTEIWERSRCNGYVTVIDQALPTALQIKAAAVS